MPPEYARPFDPKAMFGRVHGDHRFGYEQNGQLYNEAKQPVDAFGKVMTIDPKHKAKTTSPVPVSAAPNPAPVINPADDPDPESEMADVDLYEWGKIYVSERRDIYPWSTIQAACAERFNGLRPHNKTKALDMIETGMGVSFAEFAKGVEQPAAAP